MSNEIGRLFQGIEDIEGTNIFLSIHRHKVAQDAKVTYCRIVCNIRHQKKETYRVRLTVGGDRLTFNIPVSTPRSNITTSKLHWNSVILNPGSRYLVVDVNKFYLNNIMANHESFNIAISLIP